MKLGLALPGPHRREAEQIQRYCVEQGMSWKRAYAVACMASIDQVCWMFQESVHKFTGISVRTIQRAMRQAKKLGVLVSRRLRRGEQPKGADRPITCGGALRRFVAWGMGQSRMLARCARYAVRWIWHENALKDRRERERAELDSALADLRAGPG